MQHPTPLDENARHLLFLTAAWIASVDGEEHDQELDALCQLRKALRIAPDIARRLHLLARSATRPPTLDGPFVAEAC